MPLTLTEKKGLVAALSFVVGILFLRRALAKEGKGEVFIDKVTVQKAEWTPSDDSSAVLAALQRRAMEDLGVDLDLMAPTKKPTPMSVLEIEDTAHRLEAAGKSGEADFLRTLLREAEALPPGGNV